MTTVQVLALAVAAVAVLGIVAIFAIAYRREAVAAPSRPLDRRARRADRSEAVSVVVSPPRTEQAAIAEPDVAEAPAEEPEAFRPVEVQRVEEVPPEEAGVTRRQFFNRALLTAFGSYLGLLGVAMLAFFWPRLSGGFGTDIDAGTVDDILDEVTQDDGSVIPKYVPEARAYVVPFEESDVPAGSPFEGAGVIVAGLAALFQRCVHLGCRVPWCLTSQGFECPCHGSKYNRHGEYEAGPAPRNLDRFVVEVNDAGRLIIKTGQLIQTPRAQAKSVRYPQGPSCIAIEGAEE